MIINEQKEAPIHDRESVLLGMNRKNEALGTVGRAKKRKLRSVKTER